MLYAPSEADDPAYRALIAARIAGTVDYFDASAATPDPSLLANYDCIYTWTNFAYQNAILFGDRLADFVDAGGTVVLGVFRTHTSGNSLGGRVMTPGYSPVTSPGGTNHLAFSYYARDGSTDRAYLQTNGGGSPPPSPCPRRAARSGMPEAAEAPDRNYRAITSFAEHVSTPASSITK